MKKPKRGAYPLKIFLAGFMVILLFCSFVSAEEDESKEAQSFKSNINLRELRAELHPTPLEIKCLANLNLSPLYPPSSYYFNLKNQYDVNLKKAVSRMNSSLVKTSRLNDLEKSFYTVSLATLTVLNTADCVSTISALKYPGLQEANPIMKPFSKNAWLLTAVKAGIAVYNYHCLKNLYKKNKKLAWIISLAANMVMTYVVVNNLRMIQEAQSK